MFDHLGLRTARLDASIRFYEASPRTVGYRLGSRDEQGAGWPSRRSALWLSTVEKGYPDPARTWPSSHGPAVRGSLPRRGL
jgi:catechol 2,3-dioxygenase-like lactoylglutathione lyase family enzyme